MDPEVRERSMTSYLTAGVLAGMAGLLTFLLIHHFWIRPISFILPAGLPIAALGGLAVGWSYAEIHTGLPSRPCTAIAFTGLIAVILAPSVVLSQLRTPILDSATSAIAPGQGMYAATRFVLDLVLTAVLVGAAFGWLLGHTPPRCGRDGCRRRRLCNWSWAQYPFPWEHSRGCQGAHPSVCDHIGLSSCPCRSRHVAHRQVEVTLLRPNNSMEPTRPAGCYVSRDTSLGWPGGSSRGR